MRIGVDLGGTKIEAVALARDGQELARQRLATPRHDYVSRLVRLWQHAVYAHEDVSAVAVHDLCDGFATALDRPASSASLGKASA